MTTPVPSLLEQLFAFPEAARYFAADLFMMRPLTSLVLVSLCLGAFTASAAPSGKSQKRRAHTASRVADAESQTRALRRALFRTTSPQIFDASPQQAPHAVRHAHSAPRLVVPPSIRLARPLFQPAPVRTSIRPEASGALTLQPTTFTPYDRYLGTVRNVIANLDERPADMVTACRLMREGRGFRYAARDPYRADPPAVTAAKRAGDCKSKALWLYNHLGDPQALYVIGKLQKRSRASHAWVYWRHNERWWILDPTDSVSPIAADSVSPTRYVPYYSYNRAGTFRHKATSLLLNASVSTEQAARVAGKSVR